MMDSFQIGLFVWLFGWFLNVLVNKTEPLTILCAATHEKERGDHDFCLSPSLCRYRYVTRTMIPT